MHNKCLTVRLHPLKHVELKEIAFFQNKSINFIVNQAIREFIIKHKENLKKDQNVII